MIRSLILLSATTYLLPLLLVLSVYLLLQGHNAPGGGFVGGLVASAAFSLYALAHGVKEARTLLRVNPRVLIGLGLLVAAASGCIPLFEGKPFLTGLWSASLLPTEGKLGSPLMFDTGVYLVVTGMVLTVIFSLAEESG